MKEDHPDLVAQPGHLQAFAHYFHMSKPDFSQREPPPTWSCALNWDLSKVGRSAPRDTKRVVVTLSLDEIRQCLWQAVQGTIRLAADKMKDLAAYRAKDYKVRTVLSGGTIRCAEVKSILTRECQEADVGTPLLTDELDLTYE